MIGISPRLFLAGAAAALALTAAGAANASFSFGSPPNYVFPDGSPGFALQSHGGAYNPAVLVEFNPQPDPPATPPTRISLLNRSAPVLNSPVDGGAFDFLIALLDLGDGSVIPGNPVAPPNSDGFTRFIGSDGGHRIDITMQFGGSPISSWSWGAFNPQPDPPGDFASGEIGFAADPFFSFRMSIDDHPLSFTLAGVPELSTWSLMIAGFAGSGVALRRARKLGLAQTA